MEDEKTTEQVEAEEETTEVETEADTEEATESESTEEESEEVEETEDDINLDELKYDEDGNIIIPDDIDNEDASADESDTKNADSSTNADEKDLEISRLREELEELKSQSKDTLQKLGIETDDVMEGLAELAAETTDQTTDEYKADRAKKRSAEREAEAKRIADFEALAAKDLAELQEYYPETKAYKHIKDMPPDVLKEFAANRNLGLSAKKAYAAANVDGIRNTAAEAGKRKATNDNKAHLQSMHSKGGAKTGTYISAKEMNVWRGMFPNKTDREIVALYKKTL